MAPTMYENKAAVVCQQHNDNAACERKPDPCTHAPYSIPYACPCACPQFTNPRKGEDVKRNCKGCLLMSMVRDCCVMCLGQLAGKSKNRCDGHCGRWHVPSVAELGFDITPTPEYCPTFFWTGFCYRCSGQSDEKKTCKYPIHIKNPHYNGVLPGLAHNQSADAWARAFGIWQNAIRSDPNYFLMTYPVAELQDRAADLSGYSGYSGTDDGLDSWFIRETLADLYIDDYAAFEEGEEGCRW